MKLLAVCALLAGACGRLAFDPIAPGDGGDAGGDSGDGQLGDGGDIGMRSVTLTPANSDAGDEFGLSLAVSRDGSTIAVGAPLESSAATTINGNAADNSALEAGAVYVFRRAGDTWQQEAYIKAANAELGDQFGWSVALSGDGSTLAVGARHEDSASVGTSGDPTNNGAMSSGAAYVFVRAGMAWSQQAYVKASNSDPQDSFGERIALSDSGDTLAVGAPLESSSATLINGNQANNNATAAGAVYVYLRTGTTWAQQAYVKPSSGEANDEFGYRIALSASGDLLAVGAYREDGSTTGVGGNPADNAALNSGAAYVFTRAMTSWTQAAYLKASNTAPGDNFGYSLAVSADATRIAISSESEASAARGVDGNQADNAAPNSGALYMFAGSGAAWAQQAYIKASNTDAGDQLGFCVALSSTGDRVVVGASSESSAATGIDGDQADNSATASGAVYAFGDAGGWSQRSYIKALDTGAGDEFG
ncbi:MAG: hypothetical protein H0T79_19780, partial [Deltaproteobacteria bacterium]|nr:hypothetical protein [Deltaproteobacteria bacterium]